MPTLEPLTSRPRVIVISAGDAPVQKAAQERFVFEDGWVFREHHGKYVECICRFEDFRATTGLSAHAATQ